MKRHFNILKIFKEDEKFTAAQFFSSNVNATHTVSEREHILELFQLYEIIMAQSSLSGSVREIMFTVLYAKHILRKNMIYTHQGT